MQCPQFPPPDLLIKTLSTYKDMDMLIPSHTHTLPLSLTHTTNTCITGDGLVKKKQLNCIVAMSHWLALLKWGTDLLCLETVTCWVSGWCWFDMLCCHIRLMNELDVLHCCRTHILTCCGSICQVPAACGAAPGMEAVYGRVNSQQQVSHPTSCLLSCSRTQTLCLEY